ncbi:hypothetical protein OCU04_004227 [Sclerotinia nivalis]|uniref:Uncharacterized protein n=1 Tax=Sclerotinia nivalis TaxID=352851 RepID=A0A9X0AQ18_9HELO|nr:hypothetical protein OCU04_004227 [Sclerotinia nivalis]
MVTGTARGTSWSACIERGTLATIAAGQYGLCIDSWAAEVGRITHDGTFREDWGDLVWRNHGLKVLITHYEMLL